MSDAPTILEPFETDNPYLQRLFAHPFFGRDAAEGLEALSRSATADPNEQVICSIKANQGLAVMGVGARRGRLVLTTLWVRWISRRTDDFWSHDTQHATGSRMGKALHGKANAAPDLEFAVPNGSFTTGVKHARLFCEMKDLANLAIQTLDNGDGGEVVSTQSLSQELAQLTELREQGALSEEEFRAAKGRLIGNP